MIDSLDVRSLRSTESSSLGGDVLVTCMTNECKSGRSLASMNGDWSKAELDMNSSSYTEGQVWSEDELIEAAQRGVSLALEELLTRYRPAVYRAAYHFTGNVHEAEDLVQETMLRALKNIGKFRKEARFSSWLVAIAINAAISNKRKENRVHWVFLDEPMHQDGERFRVDGLSDCRLNPEQEYLDKELRKLLECSISKQRARIRVMLRWCDLDEIPINLVAERLRITPAAAKSRLFRARRMLLETAQRQARIGESI